MELTFNHIDEKDIDMLVMSRLSCGRLLDLLISELGDEVPGDPKGYELVKVQHSATTRNGESDLVAVLSGPNGKHAVLIEDKVDAPPQHNQAKRYESRGCEGIAAGDWSSFSVVLIAPEEYIEKNSEPYPHVLPYQKIRDALPQDDVFGRRMLSDAIVKQQSGWQPSRDEVMSAFYDEVALTAKKMRVKAECCHKIGGNRAPGAGGWVDFRSPLAGTSICWRGNQGEVTLGFNGWGGQADELKRRIGPIPEGTYWRPPRKGMKVVYLSVDALYRIDNWEDATADAALIVDALYKVQRLYDYAIDLNGRQVDLRVPAVE